MYAEVEKSTGSWPCAADSLPLVCCLLSVKTFARMQPDYLLKAVARALQSTVDCLPTSEGSPGRLQARRPHCGSYCTFLLVFRMLTSGCQQLVWLNYAFDLVEQSTWLLQWYFIPSLWLACACAVLHIVSCFVLVPCVVVYLTSLDSRATQLAWCNNQPYAVAVATEEAFYLVRTCSPCNQFF